MAVNRGKDFEDIIRGAFNSVPNTTVTRLPDPVMGYLGYRNICDFIIYNYPNQFFIECKTIHGNRFPFSNITDNQYKGLLGVSNIFGVIAGVLVWYVDKDVTKWIPIECVQERKALGDKSMPFDKNYGTLHSGIRTFDLTGKKKRVFWQYDIEQFFKEVRHEV